MIPVNYRIINNRKYMWDGKTYETEEDALNAGAEYRKDNFDFQLIHEEGNYFLYTRREAAE
jgi:hypothetical protein